MALVFVIFSYIGTQVVAVTAGEAKDPQKAVPRAMRSMVGRLIVFYVGAITVLLGIVPWNQIQPGSDVTANPFVKVFQHRDPRGGAHRELRGDHRGALQHELQPLPGDAHDFLAGPRRLRARAVRAGFGAGHADQRPACLRRGAGARHRDCPGLSPRRLRVSFRHLLFGGLFVWLMIFVTHLFFRRRWEALGWPRLPVCMIGYTTILGAAFLLAILLITWWVQGMRLCLITGLPWLAFIPTVYWLFLVKRARSVEEEHIARQVAKHAKIQKGLSFAPWREILVRT